ncbi:MAG: hypothetical protein QXJ51_01150 [Sulfolobales archaeon]
MSRDILKRILGEKRDFDRLLTLVLTLSSLMFLLLSVIYLIYDRPLASLLSFIIGVILLSSGLGVYRSSRALV